MDKKILPEKIIEKILVDEIRKAGGKAYKWVSPGNIGVPDRIVIWPCGFISFIELKKHGGKTTKIQDKQIETLRGFDMDARVVKGLQGLADYFSSECQRDAVERIEQRLDRGER